MGQFRLAAIAALTVGAIVMFGAPAEAGGTKVDVCHSEGNGDFHLINVSENAFDKHLNHGDDSPGEAVPGMDGYVFDADCVPVTEPCDLCDDARQAYCASLGGFCVTGSAECELTPDEEY